MENLLLGDIHVTKNDLDSPHEPLDLYESRQELLLLQSGILTIKGYNNDVLLGVPNGEIRTCITGYLIKELKGHIDYGAIFKASIDALDSGKHHDFIESMKGYVSKTYSDRGIKSAASLREHSLQDLLELYFAALIDTINETTAAQRHYICPRGDVGTRGTKGTRGARVDHYSVLRRPNSELNLVISEYKAPSSKSTFDEAMNQVLDDNRGITAVLKNLEKNKAQVLTYIPDFEVGKITKLTVIVVKFVGDVKEVLDARVRNFNINWDPITIVPIENQ